MTSIFTFENLYKAYLDCRRNKRNSKAALTFELDAERHVFDLTHALVAKTYRPLPSFCFVSQNDKYREVFAAEFRDRVVHHFLVRYLEKIWEPVFIHDSYACRKGKGNLHAVHRLQSFMRKVTANCTRHAWALQLDIRAFFPSIDRKLLLQQVLSRLKNEELHWLSTVLILHNPTPDAVYTCSPAKWDHIATHKSLFSVPPGKGLPIGNLTSQFFANVYLNPLDQFIKHQLKARYYLRYVDDLALLHPSRDQLRAWQAQIGKFIHRKLQLKLHPHRQIIRPVTSGLDFLGYIVKPSHRIMRRRVVDRCRQAIARQTHQMTQVSGNIAVINFPPDAYAKLHASLQSYLALFSHACSFRLVTSLLSRSLVLQELFYLEGYRVIPRWKLPFSPQNLYRQYQFFRSRFRGRIVIQVGCYVELFDDDALWAQEQLGRKRISPRKRFWARCGVRYDHYRPLLQQMARQKVLLIVQTGNSGRFVGERNAVRLQIPLQ